MARDFNRMKVVCRHGFFQFYPRSRTDLRRLQRVTKITLVPKFDYFTFSVLASLDRYSLIARPFGNLPATQTFEGEDASQVMRKNQFVYSIQTSLLVPVVSVFQVATLPQSDGFLVAPNVLVQPGVFLTTGQRLLDYQGEINLDYQKLFITNLGVSS